MPTNLLSFSIPPGTSYKSLSFIPAFLAWMQYLLLTTQEYRPILGAISLSPKVKPGYFAIQHIYGTVDLTAL
jgi:hypothetical protein